MTTNLTKEIINMESHDAIVHYPFKSNKYFYMAFNMPGYVDNISFSRYFKLELYSIKREINMVNNKPRFRDNFFQKPIQFWPDELINSFVYSYDVTATLLWYAYNDEDQPITGNDLSPNQEKLILFIVKCESGDWASDEEIDKVIDKTEVDLAFASSYFDYKNIEQPVQPYGVSTSLYLSRDNIKMLTMNIKENRFSLSDSMFGFGTNEGIFYSYEEPSELSISKDVFAEYHYYGVVKFQMSATIETYERQLYSFWDLTGQVGGIYEVMEIVAGLFIGYYNKKRLDLKLANKHHRRIDCDYKRSIDGKEPAENLKKTNHSIYQKFRSNIRSRNCEEEIKKSSKNKSIDEDIYKLSGIIRSALFWWK